MHCVHTLHVLINMLCLGWVIINLKFSHLVDCQGTGRFILKITFYRSRYFGIIQSKSLVVVAAKDHHK